MLNKPRIARTLIQVRVASIGQMLEYRHLADRGTSEGSTVVGNQECACAPQAVLAGETLKSPTTTSEAFGGVQCSAIRPQTEPDLMAWDPGSRSNLNRLRGEGVVAVRYEAVGCNVKLELLSHCIGTTGKYRFSPYSANQRKVAHNASELFAQLPIGAASFGAGVKGGRALRTDYMLAGQYALPPDATFRAADLKGVDCARATHVVSAIYVGAFVMGAGESRQIDAKTTLFGASLGASSSADVDVLSSEGDAEACAVAQRDGTESYRCAVPLRIGGGRCVNQHVRIEGRVELEDVAVHELDPCAAKLRRRVP